MIIGFYIYLILFNFDNWIESKFIYICSFMYKLVYISFGIVGMFVNICMVVKYVIINWEMFSMKKVNNDIVFGIL